MCSWECDDPVCPAECTAVCQQPSCHVECLTGDPTLVCNPIECNTLCGTDQDVLNTCPLCEVICQDLRCLPGYSCQILCEEIQCAWECTKPILCAYPRCELECQQPACELSGSVKLSIPIFLVIVINKLFF